MKLLKEIEIPASLKLALKILLTILALFIVLNKINLDATWQIVKKTGPFYILSAAVFYNLSQFVSAYRLNLFFQMERIHLNSSDNIKLYYQGMFYNLLLIGGIGGDGYKMITLHQKLNASLKKIFRSLLADRVNGAMALLVMAIVLFSIAVTGLSTTWKGVMIIGSLFVIPASWVVIYLFFNTIRKKWLTCFIYSFALQSIQLLAAIILFFGLGIPTSLFLDYSTVFLISSLVAALPLTIGGIGARELAFVWAAEFTEIQPEKAIAFTIIFFLINAVSSLPGAFLKTSIHQTVKPKDSLA